VNREIKIPHGWYPRRYQLPLWKALESGVKRAIPLWHRRSGKDEVCLHWTAFSAMRKPAVYWHCLPEASQARKAIWTAVNPHSGRRRIDEAFPLEIRKATHNQDMSIELVNGSIWQLVGSDNYNSLIGAPPYGLVFSEYAVADPMSWDILSPILLENGGWAVFPTTPRGKNHLYRMWNRVQSNPDWFANKLTVEETSVFTESQINAERRDGKDEAVIQQEYYCSFEAPQKGSYYAADMERLERMGRVKPLPPERGIGCITGWDLGMDDSTAIWIAQPRGGEIVFVGYYESSGEALSHYANYLHDWCEKHQVRIERNLLPHDAEVRDLQTATSRTNALRQMGLAGVEVVPRINPADGIEAVRRLLPRCWFDLDATARGRDCLYEYSRDWDEKNACWRSSPKHNWASHGADAMRTLATGWRETGASRPVRVIKAA